MRSYKWQEDPSCKHLYEAEIGVLQGGLDGDFTLQSLVTCSNEGRVVAIGWLHYNSDQRQAIKVVFPTKYPFSAPAITPLQVDKEGNVLNNVRFFQNTNQFGDGTLCLMPKEQWNASEYNIGWTLRRAQQWLTRAVSPEGFRSFEVVQEIPYVQRPLGQVLFPKSFTPAKSQKTGVLVLSQFKENHFVLKDNLLLNSPFVFELDSQSFKWYNFRKGLTFKTLFPSFDPNALLGVLHRYFAEDPHAVIKNRNIALHIPDDPNPWYFFRIELLNNQIFAHYFVVRNIDKELYVRTKDVFSDAVLKKRKVTIIGLGALGSEVAKSLAKNAVGIFHLFDNDKFEIGNSVRHAADLFYIGENKTSVAKQLIHRCNPNIKVNEYPIDVLNDTGLLEESLGDSHLCIVLTGEESVDYMMNKVYVPAFDIPFLFARVSRGGLSGSIQLVKNGATACLRCLSLHQADKLPNPYGSKVYDDVPPEHGSCSSPAVPGSEVDTKEVALQVSRIALQLLLGEQSTYAPLRGHQFYWHGPFGTEDFDPFTWEIKKLEKHSDCECCNS